MYNIYCIEFLSVYVLTILVFYPVSDHNPLFLLLAETVEQQIVRELSEKRISELNESLAEIRKEYL